ncbi:MULTISPECIES: hypothetical protein [Klebsiella pneumoniae complex]|uniref:hypothetical protein n=1 Tax=Klebsiella pneumoniae complex TaxID=3390273 RepID=UPI000C7C4C14|nr:MULTISPECIES: hypothetical protein [Klebsiella]MBC4284406.1 hypothetical protein [Klebsiella pneumoniae]MDV0625639.1 hypothetical protein [Klebsiella variicola subsp. variicola]PLC80497.1 hypothetical protein B6I41_25175 [Klebsiella pneumoniae]HBW6841816.1 hypothetical protein [Klebsiella pneumoniae]HBW7282837.1 hypothetical protein [Klebsiella pneumoniae]
MKINVTPAQLEAIKRLADDCDSMIGCGNYEADKAWSRNVKLIDRMLESNGHSRNSKGETE